MYAVIFEVNINKEKKSEYFSIVKKIKEELIKMEGFLSVESFESLIKDNKLVSLSFWESKESIALWRDIIEKLATLKDSEEVIIESYRIRVSEVQKDYTMESSNF